MDLGGWVELAYGFLLLLKLNRYYQFMLEYSVLQNGRYGSCANHFPEAGGITAYSLPGVEQQRMQIEIVVIKSKTPL